MTGFSLLTDDRLVQSAKYGDNLEVIANFSDREATAVEVIPAKSAAVYVGGERRIFDAANNAKLLS